MGQEYPAVPPKLRKITPLKLQCTDIHAPNNARSCVSPNLTAQFALMSPFTPTSAAAITPPAALLKRPSDDTTLNQRFKLFIG